VAAGVRAAVIEGMQAANGGGGMNEIIVKMDSETLYRAVKRGEKKASGRYSTMVAMG
jgi:ribonuclease HI